ncbi:MAG: 16S rRNA (cytidine(1402)-2'-O)-methyltransferase [Melioribacteraceae bacterium]|nr:16S rRNA (cytidine(1402)-2'-O)-methyltransferase [Melioribacteraceae bacterium]MCF8356237.1 16S rRNA (cytidine(1402)-2'-O)-methyltransferase [Melioribacteraceae bacterium]MCF8394992.1 16S rRNA (cytidine(1402)-2'-O)-methyltransferase [Melioribacteraceae bacterium]MCF8419712.1 16S rRNA (cytidine(1402)-2'-O)-methyltransferase [Melioribacteraceae bacterium]
MKKGKSNGKLFLVSTPIGNYDDITFRALKILRTADLLICEEIKPARRLLSHFDIEAVPVELNEHNESESAKNILMEILGGKTAALFSDGGTPLFSDPGHYLVELCIDNNVDIIPVPGANSLLPTLTASGLDIEKFYYFGWLSPKKEVRRQELNYIKKLNELIVILETPYRLKRLLHDILNTFGNGQFIVVGYKITMPGEKFLRGTVSEVLNYVEKQNLKGEFVLLIENRKFKK